MNVMITGGAYQGKASFAKEKYKESILFGGAFVKLIKDETEKAAAREKDDESLKELYKNGVLAERVLASIENKLSEYNVVIVPEVGCGLVPLDFEERQFLEVYGRVTEKLGHMADTVIRVVCGCAVKIKG